MHTTKQFQLFSDDLWVSSRPQFVVNSSKEYRQQMSGKYIAAMAEKTRTENVKINVRQTRDRSIQTEVVLGEWLHW